MIISIVSICNYSTYILLNQHIMTLSILARLTFDQWRRFIKMSMILTNVLYIGQSFHPVLLCLYDTNIIQ